MHSEKQFTPSFKISSVLANESVAAKLSGGCCTNNFSTVLDSRSYMTAITEDGNVLCWICQTLSVDLRAWKRRWRDTLSSAPGYGHRQFCFITHLEQEQYSKAEEVLFAKAKLLHHFDSSNPDSSHWRSSTIKSLYRPNYCPVQNISS